MIFNFILLPAIWKEVYIYGENKEPITGEGFWKPFIKGFGAKNYNLYNFSY
jgi:hypothetical protein